MQTQTRDPRDHRVIDIYAQMPRAEQLQRCADIDAVGYLCTQYGLDQVRRWLGTPPLQSNPIRVLIDRYDVETIGRWIRYFAWQSGRIERPHDRCLADGADLANGICVQCGRDNS